MRIIDEKVEVLYGVATCSHPVDIVLNYGTVFYFDKNNKGYQLEIIKTDDPYKLVVDQLDSVVRSSTVHIQYTTE